MSGKIMKKVLLKPEDVLQDMPYFTFKGHYQSTTFQAPANQKVSPPPHDLCCGFVKVKKKLETGQTLFLQDNRRTIRVRVVKNIRPDRTVRRPIKEMI